jgi:hypothetical protein
MKIAFWVLFAIALAVPVVRYFLQRRREAKAQREGVVVYATVIGLEPVKVFGKPTTMMKISMWVQPPGEGRRDVSLNSRIAAGQKVAPGVMLPVVLDLTDPKRIYPSGPEAMKRVQLTGSREQRRQMRRQGM